MLLLQAISANGSVSAGWVIVTLMGVIVSLCTAITFMFFQVIKTKEVVAENTKVSESLIKVIDALPNEIMKNIKLAGR